MPLYGQFETVRVLSRGAVATIETARRVDGTGGDDYVVKVFRPFAFATDEDAERQLQLFLEQAEAQRAVASITGAHWAPVHELGKRADAAFFVTDRFDVHASQLIHGRAKLNESNLFEILSGAAKGLLELQRAAGRPHGNLKPTNVLIRMGRRGGSARAVLSDPLPTSRIDHDRDAALDRHALGELLYGLVTHRRYPGPAAWPIESDKSWLAIGRHAGQWCDLCNALLASPDASEEPLSLEELVDRLERLRPRATAGAWRWAAGLAGGALLAGAAVWFVILLFRPPPLRPPEPLEETLVKFCEEAGWLEEVRSLFDLPDDDDNTDETAPSSDSTAVSDFATLRKKIDGLWPDIENLRKTIGNPTLSYTGFSHFCKQVKGAPTVMAGIFTKEIEDGEEIVRRAWRAVPDIDDALAGWRPEALVQRAGSFRELGWKQAAGTLDKLVDNATFAEPLAGTNWDKFEAARATAAGFAESGLFDDIDDELNRLREAFKAVSRELGQGDERAVIRLGLADDANLEQLVVNMERLHTALAKLGVEPGQPGKLSSLESKIGGVDDLDHIEEARQRVSDLRRELRSALYSSTGLDECVTGLGKWVTDFVDLENEIGTWLVSVEDKIDDLNGRLRSPTGVTALREFLRGRWEPELAGFKAEQGSAERGSPEYMQLARDVGDAIEGFEAHRGALAQIEEREDPGDLTWIPERFEAERTKIRSAIHEGRKELLRAIADDISKPDRDVGDWELIGETLDSWEKGDFKDWLAKRKELLNDYVRIADRLDDAFGVHEGFLGADDPDTIAKRRDKWTGEEYENMQQIVKEVRDRIDRVKRVENVTFDELQEEIDIVLDRRVEDPAFTVAVWRKHCELAEPEPKTLEAEIELLGVVNEVIGGLHQSTVRQGFLKREVADRWVAREQELTERDDYPPVLAQRGIFHIADETLDSRLAFNIALEDLTQWHETVGKGEDEPQQRKKIEEFIDARERQDLPTGALAVLDDFIKLHGDVKTGPEPSEIGPAAANEMDGGAQVRWVYDERQRDPENENGILSYIWEDQDGGQKHRLTFRRVSLDDEGSVTYLSIDEVSVGLFWDLIRERADDSIWGELRNAIGSPRSSDLVTWRWNDVDPPTGVDFTREWMPTAPKEAKGDEADYYDDDISIDPLTDGHPIQQITPTAAIYVARLINCRLPTVEEWRWAMGPVDVQKILIGSSPEENWRRAVGSSGLDEEFPNLRDETWRRQLDYLAKVRGTLEPGTPLYNSYWLPDWFGSPTEGVQAVDWDDETLWFRATSQDGGRFRNIIGNVAEFVFRDHSSILFEGRFPSVSDVRSSLRALKTELPVEVIGGSALSDRATVPVMEPLRIQRWNRGYSDVGFRLAFTAGPLSKSWETRLAEFMDPTPPFVFFASDTTDPPQGSSDGS